MYCAFYSLKILLRSRKIILIKRYRKGHGKNNKILFENKRGNEKKGNRESFLNYGSVQIIKINFFLYIFTIYVMLFCYCN